ncbi:SRPBCC family protein [Variovorax sp. ZS18.2.2]|uniref:SRPBCC family protein n=1 Tax=Variovorax sp. ZS18.2.2 TaxID=2971255 RepID=UPI0021507424|nr:SRPBCC family protein [Variovorax sp. ZS18.2.2]MCR6479068.1 SRPBCC family protein [Variovorax sp. ZS18.2.2]
MMNQQTNEDRGVQSRVIVQRVACEWRRAYRVAADPARLPDWASGLAKSALVRNGDHWTVKTTESGDAQMRFAPANDFGVLDHWVAPEGVPEGVPEVYLPFRVIGVAPDACELQFTLLRQPHMDDAAFERDAAWIARDLQSLKRLLEAD